VHDQVHGVEDVGVENFSYELVRSVELRIRHGEAGSAELRESQMLIQRNSDIVNEGRYAKAGM
jgi:hypothetical protein